VSSSGLEDEDLPSSSVENDTGMRSLRLKE